MDQTPCKIKPWIRQLAITAALALAAGSMPVFIHRSAFDQAFMNWRKNPTNANVATVERERRKNEEAARHAQMEIGFTAFVLLNGAWILASAGNAFGRRRPSGLR